MIYAIIIIIALAIAFIILVRRLPEASQENQTSESPSRQERKGAAFTFPTIKLPTFSLPKRTSKIETPTTPTPTTTPAAPPIAKPNFSLPRFNMPKWSPSNTMSAPKTEAPADILTAPVPTTKSKDDFWGGLERPQPIAEPKPEPMMVREKPKGKDQFQEAEDLFAVKDYKKAEKLYLRLAAEEPKNAKIYSRLGIIYLEQKNFEDARDALQQAIKLEPNVASRHFNLALVYMNLGSTAKAISSMEAALKYDPSNRKYRKMLDEIMLGR